MAYVKISQLPAAAALTGAEQVPIVQGGVTKRAPLNAVAGEVNATWYTNSSLATAAAAIVPNPGAGVVRYGAGVVSFASPIVLDGAVSIQGVNTLFSALTPTSAFTGSIDNITYAPTSSVIGLFIDKMFIGANNLGTRFGRNGVLFDTSVAGATISEGYMRGVYIARSTTNDVAFKHTNNAAANATGGLFKFGFEQCVFDGGWQSVRGGDNIFLKDCTFTGPNVGINYESVNAASAQAAGLAITNANCTSDGGFLLYKNGNSLLVQGFNVECYSASATYGINLSGTAGACHKPTIRNGQMIASGAAAHAAFINVDNCQGAVIEDVDFLIGTGTAATVDILIGASSVGTYVGSCGTNRAGGKVLVTDNGVDTRGVEKTPALQNGWVDFGSATQGLVYKKSREGDVHIWGAIKDGTSVATTLIFTLPIGFRPAALVHAFAIINEGGTLRTGTLNIATDGTVSISDFGGANQNDRVVFDITFSAANGSSTQYT